MGTIRFTIPSEDAECCCGGGFAACDCLIRTVSVAFTGFVDLTATGCPGCAPCNSFPQPGTTYCEFGSVLNTTFSTSYVLQTGGNDYVAVVLLGELGSFDNPGITIAHSVCADGSADAHSLHLWAVSIGLHCVGCDENNDPTFAVSAVTLDFQRRNSCTHQVAGGNTSYWRLPNSLGVGPFAPVGACQRCAAVYATSADLVEADTGGGQAVTLAACAGAPCGVRLNIGDATITATVKVNA